MKQIFVLILLILPFFLAHSQDGECKVLLPFIGGMYEGGCKEGLAHGKGMASGTDAYTGEFKRGYPHGKGTYTWASGDVYKGEWSMGKRSGDGVFTGRVNGMDTVLSGWWKDDVFLGHKPSPPRILMKYNVTNTTFARTGDGEKISISFYQNGMANNVMSLSIVTNSGSEVKAGNITSFYDLKFPFRCKINYQSYNGLRTQLFDCVLEFEISEPGSWELRVVN